MPLRCKGVNFKSSLGGEFHIVSYNHEPDLMRVLATNGKTGYALSTDLAGPDPSTPEEALVWQAERGGEPRTIPVYESDGVTQIGVFDVDGR